MLPNIDADDVIDFLEELGRNRASRNSEIVEQGGQPEDYIDDVESGCAIYDPWLSSCGRFEVDPYRQYGRQFMEWLLRPFLDDSVNIVNRICDQSTIMQIYNPNREFEGNMEGGFIGDHLRDGR